MLWVVLWVKDLGITVEFVGIVADNREDAVKQTLPFIVEPDSFDSIQCEPMQNAGMN
jgi:hypothetical protein